MNQKIAKLALSFTSASLLKDILKQISQTPDSENEQSFKIYLENERQLSEIEIDFLIGEHCKVEFNNSGKKPYYVISWNNFIHIK